MAAFVWITAKRKGSDKDLKANTVFKSYRKGYREVEKRGREEKQPTKGADQAGHHRSSWSSALRGWASQDRTHTSLIPPRGGSWCTDTPTGESSHCWRAALPAAGAPAPPAYEQGPWQEKLHRKAMQVPEARNPTWMPWYGWGVANMCCNSHRQFITQTRAIRRVKGSTISNLSGKQARFKMTWANYYARACICSCGFCIKLIWLYRVPSTWSSSVLVTEPSKVLKIKEMLRKRWTSGPRMRWPPQIHK